MRDSTGGTVLYSGINWNRHLRVVKMSSTSVTCPTNLVCNKLDTLRAYDHIGEDYSNKKIRYNFGGLLFNFFLKIRKTPLFTNLTHSKSLLINLSKYT